MNATPQAEKALKALPALAQGDIKEGDIAGSHPEDSLHRTIRLIGDLAEAMASQARRLERQSGTLEVEAPTRKLAGMIVERAEHVRRDAETLAGTLETVDGDAVADPASRGSRGARRRGVAAHAPASAAAGGRSAAPDNTAQTLAIDLKLEGRSREEVEQYLTETFGIEDAGPIVELVFGRTRAG